MNDDANGNNDSGYYKITSNKITTSNQQDTSTPVDNSRLDTEVVVSLKYLSNVWRFLDLPLINCEIEPNLAWSKNCVILEISRTPKALANPAANPPTDSDALTQTNGATFQINTKN